MNRLNTNKALHYALLCVVLLLSSCVNTLELVAPQGERRVMSHEVAVDNARSYFLTHFGQKTRSNNQAPSHEAPYAVGNLVPDWESGVTIANEHKTHTDFAMQKDFRYFLLLGENEEGQMQGVELYSRFVSVEDYSLGATSQYVATYIPDEEYLKSYGAVAQDYGINCAEWYEFSGVVLYTLPSGHHVAAYRYEGGGLVDRSFLYDRDQTNEENIADFVAVMEGLMLGVARANNGTRADVEILYFGGVGDTIIETAYTKDYSDHFYKAPLPEDCPVVEAVITDRTTAISILGGGGSGSTSTEKEEPTGEDMAEDLFDTKDLSPDKNKALIDMLSQILEDCMGKELLTQLVGEGKIAITFNFESSTPSAYNHESKSIVMTNYYSDVLLHELFHAFQYSQIKDVKTYNLASANYEVEGQLARYVYLLRRRAYDTSGRYNTYCRTPLGKTIKSAGCGVLDMKGNLIIDETSYRETYYQPSIDIVLQIAESQNLTNINYNESFTMQDNLNNLKAISIRCD